MKRTCNFHFDDFYLLLITKMQIVPHHQFYYKCQNIAFINTMRRTKPRTFNTPQTRLKLLFFYRSTFYTFEGLRTDFDHVVSINWESQWTLWRALSPAFLPANHLPCPSHRRLTGRNPGRSKRITSVTNSKQTYVETTGLLMTVKVGALLRRMNSTTVWSTEQRIILRRVGDKYLYFFKIIHIFNHEGWRGLMENIKR